MISWRRLIQDPEDALYNIYVSKTGSTGSYTKLASAVRLTNYNTTLSQVPDGASIYVTLLDAEGNEGAASVPFTFHTYSLSKLESGSLDTYTINDAYMSVNYREAGSPIYNHDGLVFNTKFCWPVDLDGDGEMEYVVNRIYAAKEQNGCTGWGSDGLGGDCLEAYDRQGNHLWTVNLGIHFYAFGGQNDGVAVGDFDGDGKGDVMVQVAEGARFWDASAKTFGKYLYYNGTQAAASGSGTTTVTSDGSDPDIDGDGVTNYTWYSNGKNPQWYFVVIDGQTGAQKDVVAMTLPKDNDMTYTRTNKSSFMNDEYSYLSPAMGAAYLDGKTQSAVAQFQCRTTDGTHHYFTYAYGYEDGVLKEKWNFRFHDYQNLSEFHHIRIGDVDGDGKDEVMNGQMAVDDDGTLLWSSGIAHGDRFRMSDIDPDRPGLEIFAIQQNAGDMLGQILYDAGTGKAIKKWYLSAVGDVGRGECMDVDPGHKGYEMWSTMPNIYNAKGDAIGTNKPYPYEGIWWDGDLGRESILTSGSGNNCPAIVGKYNKTDTWQRLYEISKSCSWMLVAENAVRAMFWGDIYGDWREELVFKQLCDGEECGFMALTTNYATSVDNIYCLLQDPNYYGQITNRGYYQSPNTGFYLGYDMPRPQLPPFIQADADHAVFDLTAGSTAVALPSGVKDIYAMPVKNQTLTLSGDLASSSTLWKSQPGTAVLTGNNYAARTIISEGTLQVDGRIYGTTELRARGTLSGSGTVGSIVQEGALNYEGCRIMPVGTLTVSDSLVLSAKTYIEMNLDEGALLAVQGDLKVRTETWFTVNLSNPQEGDYTLITYTGDFSGSTDSFKLRGLTGLSYDIMVESGKVLLRINGQRAASDGVHWMGEVSSVWDYKTQNWSLSDDATSFVALDTVLFDDHSSATTVTLDDLMPVGQLEVNASQNYVFQGDGGISGEGSLIKNGTGKLTLSCTKSDYTGATIINEGTVVVKDLADGGTASSIGAASADAANLQIGHATLCIDNTNTATNRAMTLTDTATIQVPSGTAALKGIIKGSGILRKTGGGQVNITYAGSNTWAGTILESGTLAMGSWNTTFGKAGSPFHVTGNSTITMFDCNSTSTIPTFTNVLTIDSAKTCIFNAGSRCKVQGSLLGKGTYSISVPYVRGDIYTNCSEFEGTYHLSTTNGRFVQAMDLSKAVFDLASGAYASGVKAGAGDAVSYTHKLGALTGSGTLGTGVWNVGYRDEDFTFSGVFESTATLHKYGAGAMTLTGASAGPLQIHEGTVIVANTTSATTSGAITVNSGAMLEGGGKATNVTVKQGGTLAAGDGSAAREAITITNLTIQEGGQLRIGFFSNSAGTQSRSDLFNVTRVILTSPVFVLDSEDGSETAAGSKFQIFSGFSSFSLTGDITIQPATPREGYVWDLSTLQDDGCLRVTAVDGIETISDKEPSAAAEYDLLGRKADKASGIIVRNGRVVKH